MVNPWKYFTFDLGKQGVLSKHRVLVLEKLVTIIEKFVTIPLQIRFPEI